MSEHDVSIRQSDREYDKQTTSELEGDVKWSDEPVGYIIESEGSPVEENPDSTRLMALQTAAIFEPATVEKLLEDAKAIEKYLRSE